MQKGRYTNGYIKRIVKLLRIIDNYLEDQSNLKPLAHSLSLEVGNLVSDLEKSTWAYYAEAFDTSGQGSSDSLHDDEGSGLIPRPLPEDGWLP